MHPARLKLTCLRIIPARQPIAVARRSNSSALDGSGFVALTFLSTAADGTILEADMLVNDRAFGFTTTAGSRVGLDLETVMLRELGRVLGLSSSPLGAFVGGEIDEESAIMYPVSRPVGASARTLREDDKAQDALLKAGWDLLVVDEAQNLSLRLLEQIRMFSNLETDKDKLIQIVLVGQPQLREKLARPSLEQLRQRIGVRYHMMPLDIDEVSTYIEHRLHIAGSDGGLEWTTDGTEEVYRCSKGIPRLINLICDRSLLACYIVRTKRVDGGLVRRSYQELAGEVLVS